MIADGHQAADVWRYTPRQVIGFLGFASKRRRQDAAAALSIGAMAARGDPKELKKQIEKLERD
ncbi:MAG: hypothetical protein E5Y73_35460 [Mesorhizobium sp.]|uniref:hypothetical protein n=1 Tax=Mesorhizobium sp. TaxID=1871066 RepID=UPI0011F65536|nr:hypothetical protein [Mesorhizobium sp.]TIL83950.1 MAG: hypothetical protein E5Y73_35460 [Mesorhizobium sp.]